MKAIEFLKRNKKRVAYALTALCMLLLGLFVGLLIGPKKGVEQEPIPTPEGAGVLSVLPEARAHFKARFVSCGHEVLAVSNESLEGCTWQEAEQRYPGWTLISLQDGAAVFEKSFSGYCPAHYVLRLASGELGVYRTDEATYEEKRLMVLAYDEASFDADERAELEEGLPFDDLSQVNAYIESAES